MVRKDILKLQRIYEELDTRLKELNLLVMIIQLLILQLGHGWQDKWHDIGLKDYKNLSRWYLEIAEREAVFKGYTFMARKQIPKP